jgi:outer membrane protein assembly factor BamE (lipoprotein component of BamABCDE complex)
MKKFAIALFAATLLSAGGPAFGKGEITEPELLDMIKPGVTTAQQMTEILGPPWNVARFPARGVESWDYRLLAGGRNVDISIEVGSDGIVRNIQRIQKFGP